MRSCTIKYHIDKNNLFAKFKLDAILQNTEHQQEHQIIYNGKIFSFGLRVRSAFTLEFAIFVNALSGTTIQNEQSSKSDKHQNGMVHMVITLE